MLNAIKRESNKTYTENGAATHVSTYSDCLDLFATVGALRKASEQEILDRFIRAYTEDPDTAMKIIFFARDIRGGLGERRVFRIVMTYLAANEPASVKKNIEYFGEYGRFDDLLSLMGTPCEKDMLAYVARQFAADMEALNAGESVSLLAKWLPSVNASNADKVTMAKKIARSMKMTDRDYRKAVVELRAKIRIIENNLREKVRKYDSILAGTASANFSLSLGRPAAFDCRMILLPDIEHVCDYFLWRQEDAHRNALNSHCYWTLRRDGLNPREATRELKNKSVMFKNELLFSHGINYDTLPSWQKRGVGMWFENQTKMGFNPVTREKAETTRRAIKEEYELPLGGKYAELIASISEQVMK